MPRIWSHLPSASEWGHHSLPIRPTEIIEHLKQQTALAIDEYRALPEKEACNAKPGYCRVCVAIPITSTLFDQLMNGSTGYRAHYSVDIKSGEDFNRQLVEAIAPMVVGAERLYRDEFEQLFCQRSLLGRFSKFWFPNEITDTSFEFHLQKLKEELSVSHWKTYWRDRPKPWKGLLTPIPESGSVLLNGTFINDAGEEYEQKQERSKQIFESGWT